MDEESARKKKRRIGILLMLTLPIAIAAGWVITARTPRKYRATASFLLVNEREDAPRMRPALERARKSKYAMAVADSTRLELVSKASEEWQIEGVDTNPVTAAESANNLLYALMKTLGEESGGNEARIKSITPATPVFQPERLEILPLVKYGLETSLGLAILGVVMVVRNRKPRAASPPGKRDGEQRPMYDY
jgi:hypothetical protein